MTHTCVVCGQEIDQMEFDEIVEEFQENPAHINCFDTFEDVEHFQEFVEEQKRNVSYEKTDFSLGRNSNGQG